PLETTVKANFGVDGDVESGTPVIGTDDWFAGNSGYGVIRVDGSNESIRNALLADENANISAELRMSVDNYTLIDGVLWIDAVYYRDQRTNGSFTDLTSFSSGSNTSSADPETWNIGLGDAPQKNDIIDVYGHLR